MRTDVDEIFILYEMYGNDLYFGEAVTQLQHALQAAEFAQQEGFDDDVVLAAFLHDIGHICSDANENEQMDGYGTVDHETVGAEYLKVKGFSEKICQLIAAHVPAKRYLTFANPTYYNQLSDASKKTLEFQGGKMNLEEATQFQANELFPLFIKMRLWDEAAKIKNYPVSDISKYKKLAERHVASQLKIK